MILRLQSREKWNSPLIQNWVALQSPSEEHYFCPHTVFYEQGRTITASFFTQSFSPIQNIMEIHKDIEREIHQFEHCEAGYQRVILKDAQILEGTKILQDTEMDNQRTAVHEI